MRIDDLAGSKTLSALGLGLTLSEAEELRGALDLLLASPPGRHEHVSASDYQTEITVWLEDQ